MPQPLFEFPKTLLTEPADGAIINRQEGFPMNGFADLHIHSVFSDGTLSPREIVDRAVKNGVGLIAVCDHNVVEGSIRTAPLAREAGLRFLPGVELDCLLEGCDTHILCYGADFSDARLMEIVRHARHCLDRMSDDLLERMLADFPQLSREAYDELAFDHSLGGWKLLQYLVRAGVTDSLKGGLHFYDDYGVTYHQAGFREAAEVIAAIHAAGGCAILAHPGVTFSDVNAGLRAALRCGIDGVECHYPKHSQALTETLLAFCAENGLCVTAGSDCHGAFGSADVGETRTLADALSLRHAAFA